MGRKMLGEFKNKAHGFSMSPETLAALKDESERRSAAAGRLVSMSRLVEDAVRRFLGMEPR